MCEEVRGEELASFSLKSQGLLVVELACRLFRHRDVQHPTLDNIMRSLTKIERMTDSLSKTDETETVEDLPKYEGVSINNQPIPFPMDRDGHDFHALFQYMFYTWVQNCTRIESFFNSLLNVKHG